ncbi:hypothetical protein C0989_000335, partial [Termitomyces sp. Mn162]
MGGKFAKKIAMKAVSVKNARAFVEWQRELARRGEPIEVKPMSLKLPMLQEAVAVGGSGVTRVKSREVMESNKEDDGDNGSDNDVPLAQKCPASPDSVTSTKQLRTVASKEGKGNVKMREMTPLATVVEVEWEVSDMEVEGKGKLKAAAIVIEEKDKGAEETK